MEAMLARHFAPPAAAVQDLALQRARAAKDALVARGIPAERVFLVAPKAGEAPAKAPPRRVDFALR
jgi:outer membrane protein OmpA-like peptidoglycan-associated protein